jgi:hypothetical protein
MIIPLTWNSRETAMYMNSHENGWIIYCSWDNPAQVDIVPTAAASCRANLIDVIVRRPFSLDTKHITLAIDFGC